MGPAGSPDGPLSALDHRDFLSRRHELTRAARGLLKTVLAALLRRHRPDEGQFAFLVNAYVANDLDVVDAVA